MRMRGLFVTGTDTGVGKTLLACALAAWCRREGLDVGVMKPVATGARAMPTGRQARGRRGAQRLVSDDAIRLAAASDSNDPWALITPVCFREPLAPWTAALRARRTIALEPILAAAQRLQRRHDVLIVEGVGGLLVPLTERLTVADLARRMGLPLVVAARTNRSVLERLASAPVAGPLPFLHQRLPPTQLAAWLERHVGRRWLVQLFAGAW